MSSLPPLDTRLPFWLSPWVWVAGGMAVGILVVVGYLLGAASGLWPLLPAPGGRLKPLPNALPAKPGDCRPVSVPLKGRSGMATGKICLSEDGTWALAPPESQEKPKAEPQAGPELGPDEGIGQGTDPGTGQGMGGPDGQVD